MRRKLLLMLMIVGYGWIGSHDQLQAQFVTVQNGKFMLNGSSFYFGGSNEWDIPAQEEYASSEVDARLNAFATCGGTVMRVFFFYDGGSRCGEANTDQTIQTSLGVYNQTALQALDRVVKKAKDRGMKIIATLTNFQDANGGLNRYMYWTGHVANECDFDIYSPSQMQTALTATDMKNAIKGYYSMILNRVNTVTGVAYKNEPTIMAWELVNEPSSPGNNPTLLRDWLREMAQYIKSIDSNHLVGTGEVGFDDRMTGHSSIFNGIYGFGGDDGESFTLNTQIPEIDFASIHPYPMLWGWSDPIGMGSQFILDCNAIAQSYGKPLVLGEYGHASGAWYYPGANDQAKLNAYVNWWATIEGSSVGGSLLWQLLEDGAPWWLNYSAGNVYYTADSQIWPLFKQHALNMTAKIGGGGGTDSTAPVITNVASSNVTHASAVITWTTNEASNSRVEYGTTTSYGNQTSLDAYLVTSHSESITGLQASTLYHYRVRSSDLAGNQAVSSDQTFTTAAPPPASTLRSDDFNSSSLNTSVWTFVNPLNDASYTLSGVGTSNALLSISVPAGQPHDTWTGGNYAPRIMQSVNNTDFGVEVKFQSTMNSGYQQHGITVEQDASNYMRFDFMHDGSSLYAYSATISGGTGSQRYQGTISNSSTLYMRVVRQGDQWTQSYSYDGTTWVAGASFSYTLTVSKVGVFVGTYGPSNNAPAFTGLIDYFFNTASPVVPEDGTAGIPSAPTLSSPANGATGVAANPTLSWNASSGATSYGLQVSTSSTFSTTTVNRTGITATSSAVSGLGNNTTYYWRVNATNAGGTSAWSSTRSFTTVVGSTNHNIALPQGWSTISSFVQPNNLILDSLLSNVKSQLEILKNGGGQVYWPAQGINAISNWDSRYGYQIYMNAADTLTVAGSAIAPETTPIPLVNGANLVAFLRYTPMQVDSALTSIASSLIIVKNNAGQVYWPSQGINTIGSMKPGQGYQVQVTSASTLTYPANNGSTPPLILTKQLESPASISDVLSPNHYISSVSYTGSTAILLVQSPELSSGDEIAVWTSRRLLAGSGVMNQDKALITIWGDNCISETTDGAEKDELLSLTVWSHAKQQEEALTFTSITDGLTGTPTGTTLRYKTDAVWVTEVTRAEQIPTAVTLFQNYPNPFNPSSVIKYGLPFATRVSLEVYNILGQRVATLVNEEQQAGYHQVVFENSALGSGVYFYRLTTNNNFTETKKMMIVR
jgi:regulation of enolase protein 1 (concanavalin A-like superfamily)